VSVHALLAPWKSAFPDSGIFEGFLCRTILPKLEEAFRVWHVNPSNQDLRTWEDVIKWSGMFSSDVFIAFLLKNFFPKWFAALHSWLQNNPNFEEVSRWYLNWKNLIPESHQKDPRILQQFQTALEMMQTSMDPTGALLPPPPAHPVPPTHMRQSQPPQTKRPPAATTTRRLPSAQEDIPITLKGVVEKLSQENNLVFRPTKKTWDGKPVYVFGNSTIVIDKDLIYYHAAGKWEPTGLDALVRRAKK